MKSSYCHSKNLLPKCNVANIHVYTNIKYTNTYVCEFDQIVISFWIFTFTIIHTCMYMHKQWSTCTCLWMIVAYNFIKACCGILWHGWIQIINSFCFVSQNTTSRWKADTLQSTETSLNKRMTTDCWKKHPIKWPKGLNAQLHVIIEQ